VTPRDVPDGPLVIDTDVFSWLLFARYRHQEFRHLVDGHQFVLSFATVGELRAGALSAGWGDKRRAALEDRISGCVVLPATDRVTSVWARFHSKLRDQLGKSGGNDMWIAACAAAQQPPLPVVTNNLDDYQRLAGVVPFPVVHPDL